MSNQKETADGLLKLAETSAQIAQDTSILARAKYLANEINKDEFELVYKNARHAFDQTYLLTQHARALYAQELTSDVATIQSAAERLKISREKLENVKEIVEISLKALSALGVIAAAIAAPNAATIAAAIEVSVNLAADIEAKIN